MLLSLTTLPQTVQEVSTLHKNSSKTVINVHSVIILLNSSRFNLSFVKIKALTRPAGRPIYTDSDPLLMWLWYYLWRWIRGLSKLTHYNFYADGAAGKRLLEAALKRLCIEVPVSLDVGSLHISPLTVIACIVASISFIFSGLVHEHLVLVLPSNVTCEVVLWSPVQERLAVQSVTTWEHRC